MVCQRIPSSTSGLYADGWWLGTYKFGQADSGITVDPTNANRVYLGDDYTVWRSDDAGTTWHVKPWGLEVSCSQASAVNPYAPNEIYTGHADLGLFKSTNSGATWTRIPVIGGNCWAIAVDESVNPITLYVGTGNWSGNRTNGKVFKSTNNGASWTAFGTGNGLADSRVRSITIDPTNPNIIYAGQSAGSIYKSYNKGSSWTNKSSGLTNGEVLQIAIDPSSPSTLYAVLQHKGIYKSTNGGDSWSESNHGIGTTDVWDVAIDPNSTNTIYVVTRLYGIYRSTNAGASWTNVHSNYDGLSLAIDSNSVIYAGGKAYWSSYPQSTVPGLYRSTNGTTWTRLDENGELGQGIDYIEIDPTNNNRLYISTRGDGLYRVDVDAAPDTTPPDISAVTSSGNRPRDGKGDRKGGAEKGASLILAN